MRVTPRCKMNRIQPYISAHGYAFPCCWIANEPYITRIREFVGDDDFEKLDIRITSVGKLWDSAAMQRIEASWLDGSFGPCISFCGEPFDENEPKDRDNQLWIDLDTMRMTEE